MSRLDAFKQAVQMTVEGDRVALQSVPSDEPFHVTPRKFSKQHTAEIQRLEVATTKDIPPSLQAKFRRLHKKYGRKIGEEILEAELTDEEIALMGYAGFGDPEAAYAAEHARIMYGISWQDLSDEPGPMTDEIAELIQESPEVTEEVLQAIADINPSSARVTSDSSGTSPNGTTEAPSSSPT